MQDAAKLTKAGERGEPSREIHPNVGESEKKRDARRGKMRPCLRSWLAVTYTLTLCIHLSPGPAIRLSARHSVTPMITLPAIIIHASRANKFSRDGDDKNYYRPPSSPSFRVFNKCVHASAACYKKKLSPLR